MLSMFTAPIFDTIIQQGGGMYVNVVVIMETGSPGRGEELGVTKSIEEESMKVKC